MKRFISILAILCINAALFTGCGMKNKSIEEMLKVQELVSQPLEYNSEGSYEAVFHYEKGGFKRMDLSEAYVAYNPDTITYPTSSSDAIVDTGEVTADQFETIDDVTIAIIDNNTLEVSFAGGETSVGVGDYYFIIPNKGLAGIVSIEKSQVFYEEQEKHLRQELNAEAQKTQELEEDQGYVNTDEYVDDTTKSKLGMAYDDEIIFKEE